MNTISDDELRANGFHRVAYVLWSYWKEQKDIVPRAARVHSRLFDTLIHTPLITLGTSSNGSGHIEHVVPCVVIRDEAFAMFWEGKPLDDVEKMVGRLLRIAHITKEEARHIDYQLGLKTSMPPGWDLETGAITARLDAGGIALVPEPDM